MTNLVFIRIHSDSESLYSVAVSSVSPCLGRGISVITVLFVRTHSTTCISEDRNLWTLDWEVTVSSVASMMNSGRNCLFKTLPLYCQIWKTNGNTKKSARKLSFL